MGLAGVLAGIGTAIANANGAFAGHPSWAYYLWGVSSLLIIIAIMLSLLPAQHKPEVIPVRYGSVSTSPRKIGGQWCKADGTSFTTEEVLRAQHLLGLNGLVVVNDGDPAHEVHLPSGKMVGKSHMIVENRISRLTKNDGEGLLPINFKLENGGIILGGLCEQLCKYDVDSIPIVVRYRDSLGQRYKTKCKIGRNVTAVGGLTISNVRHGRDLFGFLRRN